jgi:dolichyl-phosphate beta-glucosyltransferase
MDATNLSVTYVVGAHNEEATITQTVIELADRLSNMPGSEVIIVENGSRDQTFSTATEIANALTSADCTIRVTFSEKGLGAAWKKGANEASCEYIVLTAADLPFGFSDLDAWIAAGCPDFCIGSKGHKDSIIKRSAVRNFASLCFQIVRRVLIGSRVKDPQGTILAKKELVVGLNQSAPADDYFYSTQLVCTAERKGVIVTELPVTLRDESRSSRVRLFRDSWNMLRGLWELRSQLRRTVSD